MVAATQYQAVEARDLVFIKITMRKKIAGRFVEQDIDPTIGGMSSGLFDERDKFDCIPLKNFKIINNEIKNGTVIFQVVR